MLAEMAAPVQTVGRYALFDEIASGGMASIHIGRLVESLGFSRTVAVKRLHAQFAKDPQFVAMFLDEARLAARIRHPNVVPTLDIVSTGDELFLVMEYVAGAPLSRLGSVLQERKEHVPPRIAAAIMSGVLHGLHAAHEATSESGQPLQLVHRDVSPQNVLVGADGAPRLLDFGVAKAVGQIHTTRDGQLKGKLAYMSPEQLHSRKVDRRTDVYAAGVVLWEVLVGKRLFLGDSDGATVTKVLGAPVEAPSVARPDLGEAFDACVMRALAREADDRFQSAKEMALALESASRTLGMASSSEIGEWVTQLVGDDLKSRAQRIVEIESSGAAAQSQRPTVPESDLSSISVSHTGIHTTKPKTRLIAAGLIVLAASGAFAVVLARRSAAPVATHPLAADPQPSITAATSTPSQAEPATPTIAPRSVAPTSLAATTRHKAPQPAASSCDPPFTYEGGIKSYKPWCYGK
jgi:serine/threonine-protein kinase